MKATATKLIEKQCQRHLAAQGITSQKKLEHRLQEIFERAEHQSSALVDIYKLIIPDWEQIERLEGYPVVGRGLWQYIANLFIDFDQRNHPQIFNGGLWLNQGFSSSNEIGPWEISMDRCNVIYS